MIHSYIRLFTSIDSPSATMSTRIFREERMNVVIAAAKLRRRRSHFNSLDAFQGKAQIRRSDFFFRAVVVARLVRS